MQKSHLVQFFFHLILNGSILIIKPEVPDQDSNKNLLAIPILRKLSENATEPLEESKILSAPARSDSNGKEPPLASLQNESLQILNHNKEASKASETAPILPNATLSKMT